MSRSRCTTLPAQQTSSGATRHLVGALNTRKIGTKHHIKLIKSADGGFGIKIAERDNMYGANRPIYVTAITATGSAFRDGRLKEGDMILEVNGVDISGKSQHEVTRTLKAIGINETVDFVVSRQDNDNTANSTVEYDNDKSLIDLDVPDRKVDHTEDRIDDLFSQYVFNIAITDAKSAGLGLYLKYPTQDGKDLGIWIEKVITGGAAFKDGRLQPNDQILAINGIPLDNLSNLDAYNTLKFEVTRGVGPEALPNIIRLKIHRRGPDNQTEQSDLLTDGHSKSHLCDNDSTNSPQTQASTSLKLSSSCNDKTNDSSSAISQTTEFTSVPDRGGDDESIDATTEEERFQRDGFGRQSISEKRHAQLNAKNTDTYKKNQRLREERERHRQLELQLERQRLADDQRFSSTLPSNMHRYSLSNHTQRLSVRDGVMEVGQREVPVDVQLPVEHHHHNHQHHHQQQQHLVHGQQVLFPRSSSGRIARNRRINESFRAAVDRSYDGSEKQPTEKFRVEINEQQKFSNSVRIPTAVGNSTTFTSDDESAVAPQKKTSLLSKFLRFGSMKHDKKNKGGAGAVGNNQASFKSSENRKSSANEAHKPINKDLSNSDLETMRSRQNLHIQKHVQNHPSMNIMNGCQQANQWQPQPSHAHNGLWVLPVSDGGQVYQQNIYGAHGQHIQHIHNHHQPVPTVAHPTPVIPTLNGQGSNGFHHHHQPQQHLLPIPQPQPQPQAHHHAYHQQPPIQYGHAPTIAQQQMYNRQQQHIYYYDF